MSAPDAMAGASGKRPILMTAEQVSERYGGSITVRTLANWRSTGKSGPPFRKLGGRILYPLDTLEEWEKAHLYTSTREYGN